jgi:hypothetical protein
LKADVNTHLVASAVLLVAALACAPGCGDLAPFADACTKARDLGYITGVQLADASSSGNAIIGQGGALHRQGKVVFALRAGGVARTSPRFAGVGIRTDSLATSTRFATDRGTTATISADIAAGAVSGVRVGDTRMGGVDLLLGVTAIPNRDLGSIHVRGKPLDIALGLRLGILEETKSLPGLSLSAQLRTPPRYSVTMPPLIGDDGRHVSISLTQVDITTFGWRLAAAKTWGRFGLTGGVGRDSFRSSVSFTATVSDNVASPDNVIFNVPKRTAFVGASLALGRATTLAAEAGSLYGGHMPGMLNVFGDGKVNAPRTYMTLGIRVVGGRPYDER